MLLAEAFGQVRRYSECEHYSWVILVITFKMVGILEDYGPFLEVFLPIIDRCCDPKSTFHRHRYRQPIDNSEWTQSPQNFNSAGTSFDS